MGTHEWDLEEMGELMADLCGYYNISFVLLDGVVDNHKWWQFWKR